MKHARAISFLAGMTCLSGSLSAGEPLFVHLRFMPEENVTAAVPKGDLPLDRPLHILPMTDSRELKYQNQIGENRQRGTSPIIGREPPVTEFATAALVTSLHGWGVKTSDTADFALRGEILVLFVTEENTYRADARIRFTLEDKSGSLWYGSAQADATRWGRSMSAQNYNEEISDVLKKTYADLLSNPDFLAAWSGKPGGTKDHRLEPAAMKAKIDQLTKEQVGQDVIEAFVRGTGLTRPLTADELVAWKKAGLSDGILRAAAEAAPK